MMEMEGTVFDDDSDPTDVYSARATAKSISIRYWSGNEMWHLDVESSDRRSYVGELRSEDDKGVSQVELTRSDGRNGILDLNGKWTSKETGNCGQITIQLRKKSAKSETVRARKKRQPKAGS